MKNTPGTHSSARGRLSRILSVAVILALTLSLLPLSPATAPQAGANTGGGALRGFPQQENFSYTAPRVMPTGINQATMNQDVINQFAKMIEEFDIDRDPATMNDPSRFRMILTMYGGTGPDTVRAVTTTETMGYGMLMLAYMAGAENTNVTIAANGLAANRPLHEHLRANRTLPAGLRTAWSSREVTVKDYFDGMFRTLKHYRANSINASGNNAWSMSTTGGNRRSYLMTWTLLVPSAADRVRPLQRPLEYSSGPNSATDGDMDMAYALLVAEQQWGPNAGEFSPTESYASGTATTYGYWARRMINDIWLVNVDRGQWGTARYHLLIGSWVSNSVCCDRPGSLKTRPSDFMLQHLRAFHQVDSSGGGHVTNGGNSRWNLVINATEAGIRQINTMNNNSGVLPDFVRVDRNTGAWSRVEGITHESNRDGDHGPNSCRVPWRLGTDMLIYQRLIHSTILGCVTCTIPLERMRPEEISPVLGRSPSKELRSVRVESLLSLRQW
jgi:hypothetical protein